MKKKRNWLPGPASLEMEELMETQDVVEPDRNEVRRFVEFLQLKKRRKAGEKVSIPAPMKSWLLGES